MIRFLLRFAAIRPQVDGVEYVFAVVQGKTPEEKELHEAVPVGVLMFQTSDPDIIQKMDEKLLTEHYLELGDPILRT
jgi:hypothetical protein